jgi:NADH:quinone reductase (non-electrogenic)
VLGSGFAGSGARLVRLDELGYGPEAVQVTLVNRDGFHNIRVRYESDLTPVRGSPLFQPSAPVHFRIRLSPFGRWPALVSRLVKFF